MVLAGLALASALADGAACAAFREDPPSEKAGAFEYRVHRRSPNELVLASTPEKGLATPWLKCFYDVRSNSLLRAQPFGPFTVDEVREKDGNSYFRATDKAGNSTDPHYFLLRPSATGGFEFVPAVEERSIRTPRPAANCSSLRVRQSTYAEFAEARPERVKNGYGPVGTEFHESAGPCQLVDGRLWFGKTFYDGEGSTGIGGFGYLDTASRQYVMYSPPAIRPYSVTALLVEPETVWLGATWWGEYGPGPSRLVVWSRATEETETIPYPVVIHVIARSAGRLVLGTGEGLAVYEDGRLRPFVIEPRLHGGYEIREALPIMKLH
jgi:hypothetical protein